MEYHLRVIYTRVTHKNKATHPSKPFDALAHVQRVLKGYLDDLCVDARRALVPFEGMSIPMYFVAMRQGGSGTEKQKVRDCSERLARHGVLVDLRRGVIRTDNWDHMEITDEERRRALHFRVIPWHPTPDPALPALSWNAVPEEHPISTRVMSWVDGRHRFRRMHAIGVEPPRRGSIKIEHDIYPGHVPRVHMDQESIRDVWYATRHWGKTHGGVHLMATPRPPPSLAVLPLELGSEPICVPVDPSSIASLSTLPRVDMLAHMYRAILRDHNFGPFPADSSYKTLFSLAQSESPGPITYRGERGTLFSRPVVSHAVSNLLISGGPILWVMVAPAHTDLLSRASLEVGRPCPNHADRTPLSLLLELRHIPFTVCRQDAGDIVIMDAQAWYQGYGLGPALVASVPFMDDQSAMEMLSDPSSMCCPESRHLTLYSSLRHLQPVLSLPWSLLMSEEAHPACRYSHLYRWWYGRRLPRVE